MVVVASLLMGQFYTEICGFEEKNAQYVLVGCQRVHNIKCGIMDFMVGEKNVS